jgi:hypothetical protein
MDRRAFLFGLGAAGGAAVLGWAAKARAGGDSFGSGFGYGGGGGCGGVAAYDVEEEFLDLGSPGSASTEPLSHFFTDRLDAPASDRFLVAEQGKTLVYADVEALQVRTEGAPPLAVPATYGGRIFWNEASSSVVLRLNRSSYDRIVVVDPAIRSQEFWDDAYNLRQVVPSEVGIVLSHARQTSAPGQLSLVTGPMQTREITRLEDVPAVVCVEGTRLSFFLEQRAFGLTLGQTEIPALIGTLPETPSAAVATAAGLVGITENGAWELSRAGNVRQLVAEKEPSFLFADRGRVVVGSSRRAWICRGQSRASIEAPHSNLHHIAPIESSDDLILCRGRSVLRHSAARGRLEKIGHGRTGMKLRGAALVGDRLLTWSSRTWRVESGGGCRVVIPPRTYLID